MNFGLFTSGYQYTYLEKAFADAKAFGYDYIELWGGFPHAYPLDMDEKRIAEILVLKEKYAMPIRVYTPEHNGYPYNYMLADEGQIARILTYFYRSIDVCAALGAPYMLLSVGHAGETATELEKKERLLSFLQKITAYASRKDVVLLLETLTPYESNCCTKLRQLKDVLQTISSPHLTGMCDVVAAFASGESLKDYYEGLGERMQHVHLIDGDGISDNHLLPGEGIYPLEDMLKYLQNIDYRGGITVELVTRYLDRPSQAFARAIQVLKEKMNA